MGATGLPKLKSVIALETTAAAGCAVALMFSTTMRILWKN